MLSVLLNVPKTDQDWAVFSFNHRISHELIRQAIASQHGVSLPLFQLEPIPRQAFQQWLQWNQQAHIDINNTLRSVSVDLETLDPDHENELRAWIYLHWQEHSTAEAQLGVGS